MELKLRNIIVIIFVSFLMDSQSVDCANLKSSSSASSGPKELSIAILPKGRSSKSNSISSIRPHGRNAGGSDPEILPVTEEPVTEEPVPEEEAPVTEEPSQKESQDEQEKPQGSKEEPLTEEPQPVTEEPIPQEEGTVTEETLPEEQVTDEPIKKDSKEEPQESQENQVEEKVSNGNKEQSQEDVKDYGRTRANNNYEINSNSQPIRTGKKEFYEVGLNGRPRVNAVSYLLKLQNDLNEKNNREYKRFRNRQQLIHQLKNQHVYFPNEE